MVDVNKAVIARLIKGKKHFEILVDCENAIAFRHGRLQDVTKALATKNIFSSVRGATHAPESDLKIVFGTIDPKKIAEAIIRHGEIQLTTEHKQKLREQKKKQLITLIQRNAINPQTNTPHPPTRIANAIEQSRISVDEFKSAEEQLPAVIKKLRVILPIKFETRILEIMIPAQHATQSFHILKGYGKLMKEQWNNRGSLIAQLELPAGLQEELENQLNKLTRGNVAIEIIKQGE